MARNPEATISDLLEAAAQLFVSRAYDDIKLTDVARASGVTKGAIYHHFDSKEDVFLSMMDRKLRAFREDLRPALSYGTTTRDRLYRLTYLYLSKPLLEQRVIQLVRRDSQRFHGEARRKLIHTYQEALPNQIEEILTAGMEAGEIVLGDAQLLARVFVAHVEVYLSDYARQRFEGPEEMARHITDQFLNGVATPGHRSTPVPSSQGGTA
ncbi:TetR/AcrR family transcriptional regulator (plasmid) [Deinococcus metallilatus]|uniref:AcrR family transcriptional regulator n=1 Tax=Deinococcus metallilatus TaxID=1211322 RepID=A0AAJ5F642_9DEIO|nr:TetR/AcrR family transcriptional regulator [Deinococcus metallilatus]MBB5293364.1 AcrR family transcriptional regulator [Deinococcus metallilatus]QBY06470.1 TetR/AcrR family transcriptional regulator [Deinococcus metallilatus]RXJ17813.1 TetR/AcrR family transcriptional regulator [Deinococcus metallilatus]TLK32085.1 TetR/AcrR family transcriptional regulator [Deinococcus metallilatus]GMA15413.1 TetR family transcriptional regulator [Deinococcus metallilatus]